jgi:hypothetical protein
VTGASVHAQKTLGTEAPATVFAIGTRRAEFAAGGEPPRKTAVLKKLRSTFALAGFRRAHNSA